MKNKKRVVIKIGTEATMNLFQNGGTKALAGDICNIQNRHCQVLLVSSGAIGFGKQKCTKKQIKKIEKYNKTEQNQCYAILGQNTLINVWENAFQSYKKNVGQLLYINKMLKAKSQSSVIKGLLNFMDIGGIPIINENDAVTISEIQSLKGFGDNDHLGALVAIAMKADYFINLTNIDCVYCPETNKPLSFIYARERKIELQIKHWKNESHGGMASKLKHAKMAARKKVTSFIAKFDEPKIIQRIISGERLGTRIALTE